MSRLPQDPSRDEARAQMPADDSRPSHELMLAAGWELAGVIEELIAGGDPDLLHPKLMDARQGLMNAIQAPSSLSEYAVQAYRKVNSLRELVDAWVKRGMPPGDPDLTDLDGVCRIVKRAYRAVRVQAGEQPERTHHHPTGGK
jgi:hypothetical protein